MVLKIAITGNIASGKSQAEFFLSKHYPVYDTDKIAHEILNNLTEFYEYDVYTDGKIDRQKLGQLVFSDSSAKKKLEQLVHPQVKKRILELFEKHKNDKYIFISVPLLYEAGFETLFDKVILITADYNIRLKRLMQRNNLSKSDAIKRIEAQLPQEQKEKLADYTVANDFSVDVMLSKLDKIINNL